VFLYCLCCLWCFCVVYVSVLFMFDGACVVYVCSFHMLLWVPLFLFSHFFLCTPGNHT